MITITRLNGQEVILNDRLIETIESTPDTTITMTTGRKYIAKESVDIIIERVIAFHKRSFSDGDATERNTHDRLNG